MEERIVRSVEKLYKRVAKPLENVIFPLILLLWPLVKVGIGVDVSDSTYSLGNYLFADNLSGTWVMSTYLSNLVGSLFVHLPYGTTLIGMNVYTGLIVSATALLCYYVLRKDFRAPVLFIGEFVAISFCWIPTGILYNYLTYLLFTAGALLIYEAIKRHNDRLFVFAGIVLGLNVFVRIPNLAEAALILVVWMGVVVRENIATGHDADTTLSKTTRDGMVKATAFALLGYIIGVGIPLMLVIARFGSDSIIKIVTGLSGYSSTDDTYTIGSMILSTLMAYVRSAKWFGCILLGIGVGTAMFAIAQNRFKWLKRIIFVCGIAVLIRFFWGRGMFTFRYYEDYTAMFEWGMMTLFLSWICAIAVLCNKNYNLLVKVYAAIVVMMLLITPLGSNNYTCQNLNNMFLVVPFMLYVIGGWLYRGSHRTRLKGLLYGCNFPWMSMVIVIVMITVIQTTLFHTEFVFRDGMRGEVRDTYVTGVPSLVHMKTNADNASYIEGLYEYISQDGEVTGAIFWCDCPGLAFILNLPSAISSTWPDLDSYGTDEMKAELDSLQAATEVDSHVAVIVRKKELTSVNGPEKYALLQDYIDSTGRSVVYENEGYIVYR